MTLAILFGVFFLLFFLCPALKVKINGEERHGLIYRIMAAVAFATFMTLIFDMPVLWIVSVFFN